MSLLVILFGIAIEKFVESVESLRKFDGYTTYAHWTRLKLEQWSLRNDTVIVLIIVFLPVMAVLLVYQQLSDWLAILGFLFNIVVFLYCIGPQDLHNAAHKYLEALERGDQNDATAIAETMLDHTIPADESELHLEINKALLIATNERFLGVVFWFVLLGPMGAVLYRLSQILLKSLDTQSNAETSGFYQSAQLLFSLLNWIPSHLTAISYAVTGSFVDAIHQWKMHKSYDNLSPAAADHMLIDTGLGALQIEPETKTFDGQTIHDILALCRRSIIVWITVLAVMTLAGWAG